MKKRFFALLMALCLVMTVLPVTAYAAGETVTIRFYTSHPVDGSLFPYETLELEVGEYLADYLPDDPEAPDGYVFLGWTNRDGTPVNADQSVTENLKLFAEWGRLLTVSFDANGGLWAAENTSLLDMEFWDPADFELPEPPERDGYVFDSWNSQPDNTGEFIDNSTDFEENTTVYAQWRRIFYLHFYSQGDLTTEEFEAESVQVQEHGFRLPEPVREGWDFLGWNTREDGSGETFRAGDTYWVSEEENSGTLYALWAQRTCHVTFDGLYTVDCLWGECLDSLPDEEAFREEDGRKYRFGGWGVDTDGEIFTESTPVTGDLTLYPRWIPQAQVTFTIENGVWAENQARTTTLFLDEDEPLDAYIPTPAPDETFTFGSWNPDPSGQYAQDKKVYFYTCNPITFYTVTFDGDSEILVPEGGSIGTMPVPIREGWDFLGWFTEEGAQMTAESPITENLTLFPRWSRTLTLHFDANGGEGAPKDCATTKADEGGYQFQIPAAVPSRKGYTFLGWHTSPAAQTPSLRPGDSAIISENTTLYALWQRDPVTFRLCYHANGGSNAPEADSFESTEESHSFTVTDAIPTRSGYSFLGWSRDKDAAAPSHHAGSTISVSDEITLYAVWLKDPAQFTIVFLDRGTEIGRARLTEGSPLGESIPQDPTRSGFLFRGWNTKGDGSGEALNADTLIQTDLTAYAQWEPVPSVTVTFLDQSNEITRVTLEAGSTLGDHMPKDPVRAGYLFRGWAAEDGTPILDTTPITKDTNACAQWEKITRGTITFLDRGKEVCQITLDLGARVGENMPPEPSREGWRFLGWNTREDGTGSKLYKSTVLRADMTVYAQWEEITRCTVTFMDRSRVYDRLDLEEGTRAGDAMPDPPVRSGYSFKGWNTKRDGSGTKFYKSTTVREDLTVYAQWTKKDTSNPPTGDAPIRLWSALLTLSAAGLILLGKKRK